MLVCEKIPTRPGKKYIPADRTDLGGPLIVDAKCHDRKFTTQNSLKIASYLIIPGVLFYFACLEEEVRHVYFDRI